MVFGRGKSRPLLWVDCTTAVGLAGRTRYLYGLPSPSLKRRGIQLTEAPSCSKWLGRRQNRRNFGTQAGCDLEGGVSVKANHDSLCSCSCLANLSYLLTSKSGLEC